MTSRRIRVGIVGAAVAAMSSGALFVFPAHAYTNNCTAKTGRAVCAATWTSNGVVAAQVWEGTWPRFPDAIGVGAGCGGGDVAVWYWAMGGPGSFFTPVPGLPC